MHIQYVVQDTWIRPAYPTQRSRSTRSRPHYLPLRIFLATTLALVTVLVSLSICKDLFSRYHFSGLTPRRLSERGESVDEGERDILEGCLDMEEELGILQQRATSSSEGPSTSQITEIVSMLSKAAAEKESMQEHRPSDGNVQVAQQLLEPGIGVQPIDGDFARPHTSSLQTYAKSSESTEVNPALDPNSWLDSIPAIVQSEEQEWAESLVDTDEETKTEEVSAPPASEQQRSGIVSDEPGDLRNHPFARVPVLEEGVVPRDVDVSVLFTRPQMRLSLHVYLRTFRKLFEKKKLNQKDADMLVGSLERVVTTSWLQSQKGPRHYLPLFIVEALGYYFLAFDAIICAKQLLGHHMKLHLWWDKFVASFETDFNFLPPPAKRPRELTEFNKALGRRLIAAINIYKRGDRPPLSEVVELKTLLFCSPHGRHRLKDPMWDLWRDDAGCP